MKIASVAISLSFIIIDITFSDKKQNNDKKNQISFNTMNLRLKSLFAIADILNQKINPLHR